jgi:hypothetical protein
MIWGFVFLRTHFLKMVVQARNNFNALIWFGVFSVFAVMIGNGEGYAAFMILTIPAATSLMLMLQHLRSQRLAGIAHLFLLLTVLFFQFSDYFSE